MVELRRRVARSASPSIGSGSSFGGSCSSSAGIGGRALGGGSLAAGVVADGSRGEVWRAVALQAHLLHGACGSGPPPRRAGPSIRSFSAHARQEEPFFAASSSSGRSQRPAASGSQGVGQYAEMDYEEKIRRHQASLSLAHRMGLVAAPAQPLSREQWDAVKAASDSRLDSEVPCSICLDDFQLRPQVILSCSHVFHGECLRSFERFSGKRHCPLCRCPSYDATLHQGGFTVWRKKCASRIQRAWRGYRSRNEFFQQLRRPEVRSEAPALHRRFCGRALKAIGGKLEKACVDREDALDRFLEELDGSVAQCNEQLREGLLGFEILHGGVVPAAGAGHSPAVASPESQPMAAAAQVELGVAAAAASTRSAGADAECWAKARRSALGRGDEVDCPICFQACQLRGKGGTRVELLSCSHVFHRCCVMSFESFHVFEAHQCPVCRQMYERRPWQPTQATEVPAASSESRPPRPPSDGSAASAGAAPPRAGRGRGRGAGGRGGQSYVVAASPGGARPLARPDWRALRALG
ncbi:unnamed protein product [Polarella glacialis]|uniref:RING-type domain-containing protein n=1 Tax=Polarella glacialis TaxID=89957 RepID=A0A813F1K1_POLGL|nr:unnamed protein product [Polarella glacialis]